MHISTALLPVLLSVLTSAAPFAGGSKIDGESILLLTCKGEGKPGGPYPGCVSYTNGICIGPNGEIIPIIIPFRAGADTPVKLLRRSKAPFENWKNAPLKRQVNAKYNSMAGYFPGGVTLSAIGIRGHDTQPKALATVADPSVAWTRKAKTQELAGKMFTYTIKDGTTNGAVAGSATMGGVEFSCVNDGNRQWNAWDQWGTWQFGCTVDYACTRA